MKLEVTNCDLKIENTVNRCLKVLRSQIATLNEKNAKNQPNFESLSLQIATSKQKQVTLRVTCFVHADYKPLLLRLLQLFLNQQLRKIRNHFPRNLTDHFV